LHPLEVAALSVTDRAVMPLVALPVPVPVTRTHAPTVIAELLAVTRLATCVVGDSTTVDSLFCV
jgi:hypothetical protein